MRPFGMLVFALCLAVPAQAQMTPLTDERQLEANVLYQGNSDHDATIPAAFFSNWIGALASAYVEGAEAGSSGASAFQNSLFFPAGIQFDGGSGGSWNTIPGEHYDAVSHVRWKIRMNQCVDYTLYAQVEPGDLPNSAFVEIKGLAGRLWHNTGGVVDTTGRLAAGDYTFEGKSSVSTSVENLSGGVFALQMTVEPCPSTPIVTEPGDLTVACNQDATFCVTPNGPVGSFTYQWRRNYVPLTGTPHYSGVNSNCLTVHNACFLDVADYDCVVTANGVSTPTRLAHLSVTPGPVGVDPLAGKFWLGAPVPNPSFASSALSYGASRPFFARVTIHDAAGRTVRRFTPRMLEATGTLTWDGRSDSGTPAVPGIYFLRMESDLGAGTRQIVRMR